MLLKYALVVLLSYWTFYRPYFEVRKWNFVLSYCDRPSSNRICGFCSMCWRCSFRRPKSIPTAKRKPPGVDFHSALKFNLVRN